ncbi:hypothetical protein A5886_000047 [Enterococcus sp. 8G7_MSG3316]|uniref:DUF4809 domain-containing protein n=1 Tax=Candidatus Enterococcus testudinis TaxID=1834191 RepID=A0A242A321_9ENTE|nr:DUF4809 family protein [Enterococcus sp. 8G7_MSG3316]OTN75003.1 hypothetical protein A5886_000047 [Enterococcus sp. 8G7_MSG3316]
MEAIIKSEQVMTEGGCNACVPFELQSFTMALDNGREYALEQLDCGALVMPIAQINGWQTQLWLEEEEGLIYRKGTQEVRFNETFRNLLFATDEQTITCPKKLTVAQTFAQTNQILQILFAIDPLTFVVQDLAEDTIK